ncbi:hypothetical protein NC651_034086 [Populus alba x Populus x berolinensis]|nr:hypothetical protein NC651_034086 [Populus alba x Populus x berolinensis]
MADASPPLLFRNLPDLNAMGSSHAFGSHPISAAMKITLPFLGTQYSFNIGSSVTACGEAKCEGGCLLKPAKTIAF